MQGLSVGGKNNDSYMLLLLFDNINFFLGDFLALEFSFSCNWILRIYS